MIHCTGGLTGFIPLAINSNAARQIYRVLVAWDRIMRRDINQSLLINLVIGGGPLPLVPTLPTWKIRH